MRSSTTITPEGSRQTPPLGIAADVRIGTRGSALARCQTETVARLLSRLYPGAVVRTQVVRTEGDIDKQSPLTLIGGRGVFTSALQVALLQGRVDAAVHSAKDLPSLEPPGLELAAFPERADPRDVVVSRHGVGLLDLPRHPTIGTSSRRRAAQVRALRPDAHIVELRGNIDTRLRAALDGELDAVILAAAGVGRMGWHDRVAAYLPVDLFIPAPGQGALAVETRCAPDVTATMVRAIDDADVAISVRMERAFLRGVGGGCLTPIGAYAAFEPNATGRERMIRVHAMLASDDGDRLERVCELVPVARGEEVAFDLARRLMRAVRPRYQTAGVPSALPLAGLTVMVTRAADRAAGLVAALEAEGALPVVLPAIAIEPADDQAALAEAARRLAEGEFDWVVFTSANGVTPLAQHMHELDRSTSQRRWRTAVVGAATRTAVEKAGWDFDLAPEKSTADELVRALDARGIAGAKVLIPQGNLARPMLVDGLRAADATVVVVQAYRTVPATGADRLARRLAHEGGIDVVMFASPSAVDGFLAAVGSELAALSGACFVGIGPTTTAAMRERGLPVHAVAEDPSNSGMVRAVTAYFGERPVGPGEGEDRDA
ncbi:MAG: hydroxymethylbilane synthase [Chloroflexia bacterium]|nr:hydroxymethylbilane synthase [Chloroflexia bacterium]